MFPAHRLLHVVRLLAAVSVTAVVVLSTTPASARGLVPVPAAASPNLWAEIEADCFGDGSSPGVRWRAGNDTNGSHLLSLTRNGDVVYDVVIGPGEEQTSVLHATHWEDSYQHFQMWWKSQDQVLAQAKLWLNCIEPELEVSFDPADVLGAPCSGPVTAKVRNSGTQNGQVRILHDGALLDQFVVPTGSEVEIDVEADAGTWLAGTVWDHGAHELFFETNVVDCPDAPPEPSDLPEPHEQPQHEAQFEDEPGPESESEEAELVVDRDTGLLPGRQSPVAPPAEPGAGAPWVLGLAVLAGAAAVTAGLVTARR